MTSLAELRFFTTPSHDCSYIADRKATTLFVDPLAEVSTELYSALSTVGFRRSGNHIYRPYCETCKSCIPARVIVSDYTTRKSHKRVIKKNQDLRVSEVKPIASREYFELYRTYINERHADGDMFPPDEEQFESFLVHGRPEAVFFEFRSGEKLLAVTVADRLDDGLSAIYTFFDPAEDNRSLGVFAVLWLIEETRRMSLDYLYLGYWIKESQKMNYKIDYQPIEIYVDNHWQKFVR